ncbi:iron-containing alcohol dehydrogenase [bacterium 1XD21-13]|nr:iron-containing alcohol dehydrogenase [bacterium 1XD21-13]
MQNFVFDCKTKIIFGKGTEKTVGENMKALGSKVLFHHYGEGYIKECGLYDVIMDSLKTAGLEVVELTGVKPNPEVGLVRTGVEICKKEKIDCILAVGGGSVMDSAKAIGLGALYEGDVWDFFEHRAPMTRMLPIGVISTIPATGSEMSDTSVMTNDEGHLKRHIADTVLRPAFAILNPELTYTLPPYQTAVGGVDIFSHVVERYFTQEPEVDYTDRLCEATMRTVIKNLPLVMEDGKNYAARAEIMLAAPWAQNGLLGMGRIEDWGSHMMGHEISGIYNTAHGATLSIIMPQWMKYVYKDNVDRFAQYAVRVWDADAGWDKEKQALYGIEKTREFFRSVCVPVTLKEAGIDESRLEEMAEKCCLNGPVGGFRPLYKEDVLAIYQSALQ